MRTFSREFYSRRKSAPSEKSTAASGDPEVKDDVQEPKNTEEGTVNTSTKAFKKAESGINVITGRKVVKINAERQEAELDNGRVITYGKCLLATGGKPKVVICSLII